VENISTYHIIKVKNSSNRPWKPKRKVETQLYSFFNLVARWGWVDNTLPLDLLPLGNRPGILAPGLVWTGVETLVTS
jgi:hypothetical protein